MSGCLCLRLPGCCGTHGPPRLLFRNADAWSGVGGAVPPFDLPTHPSGDNNRSSLIAGRVSKDQWWKRDNQARRRNPLF